MENIIKKPLRTNPEIVTNRAWLTGYEWEVVALPHKKTHVSTLTMGRFQNHIHTEIHPMPGNRVDICTVTNNQVWSGGTSKPYKPEEFSDEVNQLLKILFDKSKNKY